jgi:PST family polysaccharide transporter
MFFRDQFFVIRSFFKSRSLSSNIASLSGLQVANFLITLALIPYLARALGLEEWGRVTFVLLVVNYLLWISNWSFYLGATKKIAAHRNEPDRVAYYFINTFFAQWFITLILIAVSLLFLFFLELSSVDRNMYLLGIGILIGNALTPLWYLNGLERIKEAAFIQLLVKLITIPPIFLFIENSEDADVYILITSLSTAIVGVFVTVIISKSGVFRFDLLSMRSSLNEILEETQLFLGSFWANARTQLIPTVLGVVAGPAALGLYALAERARSAAIVILHPVSQALFPRMCYLFNNEESDAKRLVQKSGVILFVLSALMSVILFVFSESIINVLGGEEYYDAIIVLELMAVTPLISTMFTFAVHQIIIPAGESRMYNRLMLLALVINGALIYPAVEFYSEVGAASVLLLSEIIMVIFVYFYLLNHQELKLIFRR